MALKDLQNFPDFNGKALKAFIGTGVFVTDGFVKL
jgi:hypothetical protein